MTTREIQTRLFGFFGHWRDPGDTALLAEHARTHVTSGDPRGGGLRTGRSAALVAGPHVFESSRLQVVLRGHPSFHENRKYIAADDPARRIAEAYLRSPEGFLELVHGSFALAIIDSETESVVLALDRMGIEQLAYVSTPDGILFSTSIDAVARAPGRSARLRRQAIFDYLLVHMVPSPATAYEGVEKLRAGTRAVYRKGRLEVARYWKPAFGESGSFDATAGATELKEGLRQAVAGCADGAATGAFLSGGLDSSSVAGMLCRTSREPPPTFSIGFGVDAYNEIEYARIASRHFGSRPHEYDVTPDDIVTALPKIAAAYDEPFGNSSAVPTYFCAKLAAEHGVHHLLAGDGGDEIFGGNERYARQKVFEAYHSVPRLLRSALIEPLSRVIHPESRITPLRKLRSYVDQAKIVMPERLETWNFMYRADLGQMLEPGLREGIDTRAPLRGMSEVYGQTSARSLVNKMLFYDWQYTLADNDLRKVNTMCELAGVRVSYPMLDPRLIDLSLRIPPAWKVKGFELRAFYKHAMSDFLPEAIIRKTKHGFGLPFGVWLKTHKPLGELIYGLLGGLKTRRLLQPAFLDQLIEDHRTGHPNYFGYAIWDLAMLEAWLQAHPSQL